MITHTPSRKPAYPVPGSTAAAGTDLRPSQVFHGYPSYPAPPNTLGSAMPPPLHDGMSALAAHHPTASATASLADSSGSSIGTSLVPAAPSFSTSHKRKAPADEDPRTAAALYGALPEAKRRKFILVDDAQRRARVRVRVTLGQVTLHEMPDSYRRANSVFPRAYFPMQMQEPGAAPRNPRFFADDEEGEVDGNVEMAGVGEGSGIGAAAAAATTGRTVVPVPLLEGGRSMALPMISRAKKRRETTLNELGYRMSWSQSRVFAGRVLFLQKSRERPPSLDNYPSFLHPIRKRVKTSSREKGISKLDFNLLTEDASSRRLPQQNA